MQATLFHGCFFVVNLQASLSQFKVEVEPNETRLKISCIISLRVHGSKIMNKKEKFDFGRRIIWNVRLILNSVEVLVTQT